MRRSPAVAGAPAPCPPTDPVPTDAALAADASDPLSMGSASTELAPLLHDRTFVALLVADVQSVIGDQIARVALSVLVFTATRSAAATALTYAATFVPAVLGGALLAGVADAWDRRAVMIGCEVTRAALFGLMIIPGVGVAPIVGLLVAAVLLGPVFGAARTSYLSNVLAPHRFGTANGIRLMSDQVAQVVGFGVGGVVVGLVGPFGALGVDAATFLVSASLVTVAVHGGARRARRLRQPVGAGMRSACATFRGDPLLSALLALSAVDGLFIVPEGLTVPFARDIGAPELVVGVLFAALPLGAALGAGVLVRVVPAAHRPLTARWLAALCGVPLVVSVVDPPWPVVFVAWTLCGVGSAYQVEAITTIAQRAPDAIRARVIGFGGAVVLGAQGLGLAVFGLLAWTMGAGAAIALAGLLGALAAAALATGPLRRWSGVSWSQRTQAAEPVEPG